MNGQPAEAPPNRWQHRLKTVALVLVGFLALYFVYHFSLSLIIHRQMDSIRRAGFPATCAELDKWYVRPPTGQNAADVYAEAFAHYDTWTNELAQSAVPTDATNTNKFILPPKLKRDLLPIVGEAKLPPRTDPFPAEMQQRIAGYLADNSEALRLLHQAAAMKSCRYPIDLTKGVETKYGPLNSVRQAARLLDLESIEFTEEQQPQKAVDSVIASFDASRSLNQEPLLIPYLVQCGCQGINLESLKRVLERMPLADDQLVKLAATVQGAESQQTLTRAFVGERCMGFDLFQGFRTGKIPPDEMGNLDDETFWIRPLWSLYKAAGLLELDEIAFLGTMEQYVKVTQLPSPKSVAAASAVDDKVEHLSRWHVLSRMLLGSLNDTVSRTQRYDAKIHDAETAIAIERYRLANGKLPDQLSDLVPTFLPVVPADPFDGKPLRYKKLAKGYVVYSVGEDREDNGGAEKNAKGASYVPGTDVTFTVER